MKIEIVERYDRQRNRMLLVLLVAYAVWWGCDLVLLDSGWHPTGAWRMLLQTGFYCGILVWLAGMVWMSRWLRALGYQSELAHALNDEVIVHNRMRAMRTTFWLILIYLVGARALAGFVTLSTNLMLDLLIWLLVVSYIGAYLLFSQA